MERNFGLVRTKKSRHDYDHRKSKKFGVLVLPQTYILESQILDQNGYPRCTGYSGVAVKASVFGREFDPEAFYRAEGVIAGKVSEQGYDLRILMETGIKYGALPLTGELAGGFKDRGYFKITGSDLFEAVRQSIYAEREKHDTAVAGVMWYNEWSTAPTGIVQEGYKSQLGLHAVKIAGFCTLNEISYIVIQNSFGTSVGNRGLFYFNKEIFNREFREGIYIWSDTENLDIKTISILQDILNKLSQILKLLFLQAEQKPVIVPINNYIPPPAETIEVKPKSKYDWSTPTATRHSARMIMDTFGLSWNEKDLLCAVIEAESHFDPKAIGKPNANKTKDWGLCQFNDGKNLQGIPYWIGKGAAFASTDEVLNDPEKNIRIIIQQYKAGNLKYWSAYTNGSYKKYLIA